MNNKDTWRSYWRLSALSVGIALLSTMVLLAGQRWYSAQQNLGEELREDAQIFGTNASAALAFGDAKTAEEILAAVIHSRVAKEVALYLPNGKKLAGFKVASSSVDYAPPVMPPQEGLVATRPGLRQSLIVRVGEHPVGHIVLWATLDGVYDELREFLLGFVATALVAGLLAYLAGYRLRQTLTENQQELEQSTATIRLLAARREKLVEDEHKRIAREIHDELGQVLTAALMGLKQLKRQMQSGRPLSQPQVDDIEALIAEAMRSVRNIAADLRPAVLNIGFQPALEWLAERMLDGNDIRFRINLPAVMPSLNEDTMTALFRIVQESLTNVVRHAHAKSVDITLCHDAGRVTLKISDDGIGFVANPTKGIRSLGLVGMKERATALGASLDISSTPGTGTRICVTLDTDTGEEKKIA